MRNNTDSNKIKQTLFKLGADFCGIASIDRFNESPEGYNPVDTLKSCKSVIVFGKKFLKGTLDCENTIPYTIVRNLLSEMLDTISVNFCCLMENENTVAVPIGTISPTLYDKKTGRYRNVVSVKHAAVLAGLGYIGKNSLLINPEFGNMIWLSAVLTNAEFEPDAIITETCPEGCNLCIDNCPVNAIKRDNQEMDQEACLKYAFHTNERENFYFKCNKCRTICPKCLGKGKSLKKESKPV
jgi:epoxyqueuosine reductase QueG